jgi:helicase
LKTAFLLEDWIEEKSYDALVLKYNIWPGDVHNVVEIAEWLLHATREFARMYNFSCVSNISDLLIRVQNGCKEELLNLVSLKGIGRVRARALYHEGFKTVNDLRNVPLERIAKIKTIGKAIATNIKQQIGESDGRGNKELRGFKR